MDMNNINIEEIVKQVLSGMTGNAPAAAAAPAAPAGNGIPKTARVAMLTSLEHYDLKEYPIPEIGDDDMLVKVEGCGVCGTDAHEFKRDPFSLIPVVLGHEGTGEIVKMGKNVKVDTAGKPVKVGDKIEYAVDGKTLIPRGYFIIEEKKDKERELALSILNMFDIKQ